MSLDMFCFFKKHFEIVTADRVLARICICSYLASGLLCSLLARLLFCGMCKLGRRDISAHLLSYFTELQEHGGGGAGGETEGHHTHGAWVREQKASRHWLQLLCGRRRDSAVHLQPGLLRCKRIKC